MSSQAAAHSIVTCPDCAFVNEAGLLECEECEADLMPGEVLALTGSMGKDMSQELLDVEHTAEKAATALANHDLTVGSSLTLTSTKIRIAAGSEFSLPVFVHQAGTELRWSFHLDEADGDIAFDITQADSTALDGEDQQRAAQEHDAKDGSDTDGDSENEGSDDEDGDTVDAASILGSERVVADKDQPLTGKLKIMAPGALVLR